MATPRFLHLSRRLTTAVSSLITSPAPRFSPLRALAAVRPSLTAVLPSSSLRLFNTITSYQHAGSSRITRYDPKEQISLDGCDFKHWLIVFDTPPVDWSRDQIIDFYVKTLAEVVGSEEETRKKIYSVSTKHYFSVGALMDEETSAKFKEMKNVKWVLPDSYLDIKTKNYGGEPFINGEAVPYDPKYHAELVRNTQSKHGSSEEHSLTAKEPGGSPNNADSQQNVPPKNAGDQ